MSKRTCCHISSNSIRIMRRNLSTTKPCFTSLSSIWGDQESSGLLTEHKQLLDTKIWNALFEFQKDGVKGAINKIRQHNGCIIADSVGLGKTFEALAVIKYFELQDKGVLVLCPNKLRDNWNDLSGTE